VRPRPPKPWRRRKRLQPYSRQSVRHGRKEKDGFGVAEMGKLSARQSTGGNRLRGSLGHLDVDLITMKSIRVLVHKDSSVVLERAAARSVSNGRIRSYLT
jgi:hypothetical protein